MQYRAIYMPDWTWLLCLAGSIGNLKPDIFLKNELFFFLMSQDCNDNMNVWQLEHGVVTLASKTCREWKVWINDFLNKMNPCVHINQQFIYTWVYDVLAQKV